MPRYPKTTPDALHLTDRAHRAAAGLPGIVPGDERLAQSVLAGVGRTYGHDNAERAAAAAFVLRRTGEHADLILEALGLVEAVS